MVKLCRNSQISGQFLENMSEWDIPNWISLIVEIGVAIFAIVISWKFYTKGREQDGIIKQMENTRKVKLKSSINLLSDYLIDIQKSIDSYKTISDSEKKISLVKAALKDNYAFKRDYIQRLNVKITDTDWSTDYFVLTPSGYIKFEDLVDGIHYELPPALLKKLLPFSGYTKHFFRIHEDSVPFYFRDPNRFLESYSKDLGDLKKDMNEFLLTLS